MSSSHHLTLANSTFGRRKYPLRRPSPNRKRAAKARSDSSSKPDVFHASSASRDLDIRPVLVPLHPNLRRLPSRILLAEKHIDILDSEMNPRVGSKRKRVTSAGNENAQVGGRPTRGSGRLKRFKSSRKSDETSEDEESMQVDAGYRLSTDTESDIQSGEEQQDEEQEDVEGSDDESCK